MNCVFLPCHCRRVVLLLLFVAAALPTFAQRKPRVRHVDDVLWHQPYYRGPLQYIFSFGRPVYYGDLGGLSANQTRASYGVGVSYTAFPLLDVALEGQFLRFRARDQDTERGYRFHTEMAELTLMGRYYFEKYHFDGAVDSRDQARQPRFRFFGAVGGGAALWWPTRTGGPASADSLGPEQKYPAHTWLIPVGAGFSMRVSPRLVVLPEVTYRFTLTDNLDDVGTKRGGGRDDGYLQVAFRFQYAPPRSNGKPLR